jgi:hypothetical protein
MPRAFTRMSVSPPQTITGAPAYMSPEQQVLILGGVVNAVILIGGLWLNLRKFSLEKIEKTAEANNDNASARLATVQALDVMSSNYAKMFEQMRLRDDQQLKDSIRINELVRQVHILEQERIQDRKQREREQQQHEAELALKDNLIHEEVTKRKAAEAERDELREQFKVLKTEFDDLKQEMYELKQSLDNKKETPDERSSTQTPAGTVVSSAN